MACGIDSIGKELDMKKKENAAVKVMKGRLRRGQDSTLSRILSSKVEEGLMRDASR